MKWLNFLLTLLFVCVVGIVSADAVSVTLTLKSDKIPPEGGHPQNVHHYNTFEVDVNIPNLPGNNYYLIEAKLTSTKYKGYAANYGSSDDWDLQFANTDYPASSTPQWTYINSGELTYRVESDATDRSVPKKIYVRCYDWGAYGTVKVTVKQKTGWFTYTEVNDDTEDDTEYIPKDDNKNKIFDGWENDATRNYTADLDDENVPAGTYQKGDGWSVYEEYRGLFLTKTDTTVTRLNPRAKDVLICYESGMETYGLGAYSIPHHSFNTIKDEEGLITKAFADIHNADGTLKRVEKAGWVNKNSKGVPGAEKVWAIRVIQTSLLFRKNKMGDADQGSPSHYSKIRIHTANIKRIVKIEFRRYGIIRSLGERRRDNDASKNATEDAVINAAVEKCINVTLSHEFGHTHAIYHCSHKGCIMKAKVPMTVDKKAKTMNFNTSGFNAGHGPQYAATDVIGGTAANCDICGPVTVTGNDNDNTNNNNQQNQQNQQNQPVAPTPTPPPQTPTTVMYTCGIHSGDPNSASSDHSTMISGYSGSFYECQPHQTFGCGHQDLTSNSYNHRSETCPTNSNGVACTSGSYYACQSHTHQYPAPTISCGRSACSETVGSTNEHRETCASGHLYWNCNPTAVRHHITRTCRFSECGRTWEKCTTPITPVCNKPWRKRNGLKCWGINE